MILKFIVCKVVPEQRDKFSKAQCYWQETAECQGFGLQTGGWDIKTGKACALVVWENKNNLDWFMQNKHDPIWEQNRQRDTYESCEVVQFQKKLVIPAFDSAITPEKAEFIRVADCWLFPGENKNFENVQERIWNPGMSACQGMLGGYMWQDLKNDAHYLVTTFWESEELHSRYTKVSFPVLRKKANVEKSVRDLDGYQIDVNKDWIVTKN